jgi:hypothetical protein
MTKPISILLPHPIDALDKIDKCSTTMSIRTTITRPTKPVIYQPLQLLLVHHFAPPNSSYPHRPKSIKLG